MDLTYKATGTLYVHVMLGSRPAKHVVYADAGVTPRLERSRYLKMQVGNGATWARVDGEGAWRRIAGERFSYLISWVAR